MESPCHPSIAPKVYWDIACGLFWVSIRAASLRVAAIKENSLGAMPTLPQRFGTPQTNCGVGMWRIAGNSARCPTCPRRTSPFDMPRPSSGVGMAPTGNTRENTPRLAMTDLGRHEGFGVTMPPGPTPPLRSSNVSESARIVMAVGPKAQQFSQRRATPW